MSETERELNRQNANTRTCADGSGAVRSSDAQRAMENMDHRGKGESCATCWHCQPGTPFKGYCMKWGISVSYSETCKMHKEASERRKKEIAQMQTWFEDHGYVEVKE